MSLQCRYQERVLFVRLKLFLFVSGTIYCFIYSQRIQIYSKMDIGENQYIPREPEKDRERVLTVLKSMDTYSKIYVTQPDMDSYRHLWYVWHQ